MDLCRKVSVKLTLHDPDEDVEVYRKSGLMGLRRHKLLCITKEAIEQGALLSYEDIAFILTSSTATIKRDMATMRRAGLTIPTRGWRHDMGRGSFKSVRDLIAHIERFVSNYNPQAKPFVWTATADSILEKLQRLCQVIYGIQH